MCVSAADGVAGLAVRAALSHLPQVLPHRRTCRHDRPGLVAPRHQPAASLRLSHTSVSVARRAGWRMVIFGRRCHNDAPVTVTILDCTAVQRKENDADSIVRFYNCEVAWGDAKWRVSRR